MEHTTFHYRSLEEVRAECESAGAALPLSDDIGVLSKPLAIGGVAVRNRLAVQPMEGSDGLEDGAPGELTFRRCLRFARGGAALVWLEATASAPEARASAHQLMLTEKNLGAFQKLADDMRSAGMKQNGYAPILILQDTNSGRYSKPNGVPEPIIAANCPPLEDTPLDASRIVSDDKLRAFEDRIGETAALAQRAGFDGVDIKCCHRYLANEMLSAYTRKGPYGGSFENRTRFLMNCFRSAKANTGGNFLLTTRMNVYDGFPYPYGFGTEKTEGSLREDFSEPIALTDMLLSEFNIPVINITCGNPYRNPHVNRPYDRGNYVPGEHPLFGVARLMRCAGTIQRAYPNLPVIASGFTYLRQFSPNLAAGMVKSGYAAMAGFGRMALANPDFANQILSEGGIKSGSSCVACSRCAALLRRGVPSGCAVRDGGVYHYEEAAI